MKLPEGVIKSLEIIGMGTVEFFSEITISSNFTAECTENAEALKKTIRGLQRS